VELLGVDSGVVRLRLSGACSGCTASAQTLRDGVQEALREGFPGFGRMEVEEDLTAAVHAPPGATLLQIEPRPR
jgi:Fe-S cluster biogenesis protein NfuA